MADVSLNQLFSYKRLPTGFRLFLILLYFPVGVCLALVRFFIGLHVYIIACVLPKTSVLRRLIMRPMCAVLGIMVVQEDCANYNERCGVVIANYTTKFDYVPLQLVFPHHVVSIWNFSDLVTKLLGYLDLGAQFGRETLIANAKRLVDSSDIPLLSFPEGTTTNGKAGLLKFSVWPFSLDKPVQPIVITLSRPGFSIEPSLTDSQLCVDWFWLLFVPCTVFHISYLPIQSMNDDEEASEFAKRVQKMMAHKMGICPTNFTCSDKMELSRRLPLNKKLPENEQKLRRHGSLQNSLEQVKNVLPHVPDSVIIGDLAMTKDVDLTVANILEGRTGFAGAELEKNASSSDGVSQTESRQMSPRKHPSPNVLGSSTFGKTSHERHQSFQDRKKQMIEQVRQRYLGKFGSEK